MGYSTEMRKSGRKLKIANLVKPITLNVPNPYKRFNNVFRALRLGSQITKTDPFPFLKLCLASAR